MKLWKLYPRPDCLNGENGIAWEHYDGKLLRLVIRAETEDDARRMARHMAGTEDEVEVWENGRSRVDRREPSVWCDPDCTVCEELTAEGLPGIVLKGVRAG